MELSINHFDFAGWATCANLKCSDGRTIIPDAFKHQDGEIVPLVWNHQHNDPTNILGKALLHSRDGGMYAYCQFNDTEQGQNAKILVEHGDICALSIHANQLKHTSTRGVTHGMIREVSLVLAGANPKAFIDTVIKHGEEMDDEGIIYTGEEIVLFHSEEEEDDEQLEETTEEQIEHAEETKKEDETVADEAKKAEGAEDNRTVKEAFADAMKKLDETEQTAVYAVIGAAIEDSADDEDDEDDADDEDEEENVKHSEGGDETMKENVFDQNNKVEKSNTLTHADQEAILELAKQSSVGSLRAAMEIYAEQNSDALAHGWNAEDIGKLFPDYKDVHPGAPELIERDQSWVGTVLKKTRKSPISRIRTRQADARANELRAKGYNDREVAKKLSGDLKLIMRTTDPQTVYRRDELHRDDITDITDFDVVAYQKTVMKHNMEEELALAALIGDGREDTDQDKIHENHIRSVWNDEELYTIHYDVDIEGMRSKLQGSNTSANFGEEYIYAESIIAASLYSRENYKGKGTPDFYCTPRLLNTMLLARDLNGHRIYKSTADLAAALNVGEIHTVEQFAGKTRTTKEGATKKLLGLFVNMGNYQFGSTKGGELTNHEQFDIDFNKYKYLMETRLSGALVEIQSAIALEEAVAQG